MWCSSRENQSTKLQRPTSKNTGLCTTRSRCYQDRLQKPKSHNDNSQPLRRNQKKRKSQQQSTQGFYCNKRPRRTSQQPAEQHAGQHKGPRQDRPKGPSPPRNSRTKTSTNHLAFGWQSWQETWIQTTRTNQRRSRKLSIIRNAGSSGRKLFEKKSTVTSRTTPGILFAVQEIAKSSPTSSRSNTKRTNSQLS